MPVLRYYQGWGLKLKDIVALLELDDLTGLKKSYDDKIEEMCIRDRFPTA